MENPKSIAETTHSTAEQWAVSILVVLLLAIIVVAAGGRIQDSRAGHQEIQTAVVTEKIYRRPVNDLVLVPVDANGTTIAIDSSTAAKFFIKLTLPDRAIVQLKVRKFQFASINVGASVKFRRWVGRSGKVYRQSILIDSSS
jgi:hypothetical protein